ncbi:PASTA domain-containing protein [Streptosporangium sp. NBC_01469]|uniref:PASTA domain-containing protein n=1 Tax=Streptosporangium sp. NBC_01469 TaxID=2903898 RepID=UPI002E2D69BB|nr:PASTA domain-containing protein [Streptosporangium sp. NBC_01469]
MRLEQELSEAMGEHVASVRAPATMGTAIRRRHRARRIRVRTAGAALVTAAVAAAVPSYVALNAGSQPATGGPAASAAQQGSDARAGVVPRVKVPSVLKLTVAEARAILEEARFAVTVEGGTDGAEGTEGESLVVTQTPPPGESAAQGSTVRLVTAGEFSPSPTSSPDSGLRKAPMPQDLGDLGDGRAFGGVRFGYLPEELVWGKWSVKNAFGTTSYSTSWRRSDVEDGAYAIQAMVFRGDAAAQMSKRMKNYGRQGAELLKVGGRNAYLAPMEAFRIEEGRTLTLVWAVRKGLVVQVMMSPGYEKELGDRAKPEIRKVAEGVAPTG